MRKTWLSVTACAASLGLIGAYAADQPSVQVKPGGGVTVRTNDDAADAANDSAAADAANDADAAEQDQNFFRASELIGTNVKGQDGQSLGRIQDLLIDRRNQQIRYFILGDGKTVSAAGNRDDADAQASSNLHVIPWTVAKPQFTENRDDSYVTVPLEPQRLQQAPAYTWQQIRAPRAGWVNDVNRFYNVQPGNAGNVNVPPGSKVKIQRDGDVKIKRND